MPLLQNIKFTKYFGQLEKYVFHLLHAADPFLGINIKAGYREPVNYYHLFMSVTDRHNRPDTNKYNF